MQSDIFELEEQKNVLNTDRESDSSRATLSEIDAILQLQNEITLKNKHLRKLLNDIKVRTKKILKSK